MIDRYDAPEGMVAVRVTRGCVECFFYNSENTPDCIDRHSCLSNLRADEESVIFKTRDEFESMLKQEVAQFYGFEKDDVVILSRHEDKHS